MKILFENKYNFEYTPISNIFLNKYIKDTNHTYILVYILLFKLYFNNADMDISFIANELSILDSDVLKALEYWNEKKVFQFTKNEGCFCIKFVDLFENNIDFTNINKNIVLPGEKPKYSSDDISKLLESPEIKSLISIAEKTLCKTFTSTDRLTIISFYEWLELPLEVLAILFTYCSKNNKTNIRYIEKVAIDWAENGICSQESAENYLKVLNTDFAEVLGYFGIKNRLPIDKEEIYLKKWLLKKDYPKDLIKEACSRAVLNTNKTSFSYADSILESWEKLGIKCIEDVLKADDNYVKNQIKQPQSNQKNINYKKTKNKFVNYTQPDYDFEKLSKISLERLMHE